MQGAVYRTMPRPPGPQRAWRVIIERCLAVFNGLVLAALLFRRALVPHDAIPFFFHLPPLLALIGFLAPLRRWQRVCLTAPSGLLWPFMALALPLNALVLSGYAHRFHPPIAPSLVEPFASGFLFFVAAVLTIELVIARMR